MGRRRWAALVSFAAIGAGAWAGCGGGSDTTHAGAATGPGGSSGTGAAHGGGGAGGTTGSTGGAASSSAVSTASSSTGGAGGSACADASCCVTGSMVDLYPGAFPNNPYGPQPTVDACTSQLHDVIIVLGCPNADNGDPAACQTKRADLAVALMKAGYGDRFITSGAAAHNQWVEADTLRDLLIERGVAADHITTEIKALHTDENIYYSTKIMETSGWESAVVVSDDPGHLIMTALCDSNCCVDLGRLTVFAFPISGGFAVAGHYVRYPWGAQVSDPECAQIEQGTKFMCVNLATRKACKDNFQL